jgi:cardiolipin synthase
MKHRMGAWMRPLLCLALLTVSAGGCALPPSHDELAKAPDWQAAVAAHAPSDADRAELKQAAATPDQEQFVLRVSALEAALTGHPLVPGNKVTLLVDGPATHTAQLAAMAQARHHVHLVVYIFTDEEMGQKYLAAFRKLTQRGVKVRVMFDHMGARGASPEFRKALADAGVEIAEFGPLNPTDEGLDDWETSHRNHRKILVVDGKVAFTGGANISDEYTTAPGASMSSRGWRDTNVRIDGPAVAEFQKLFLDSWEQVHGPVEKTPDLYPKLAPAGHELVRAVEHDGKDLSEVLLAPLVGLVRRDDDDKQDNQIYGSYLAAMGEAQRRIWITQAYFIPNQAFLDTLKAAAARGVDVRVLVPGYTDVQTMLWASHYYYDELLEAGVKIFEYTKSEAVLHAKTAVIDGVWGTVGSSNLDFRSFIHNDEANAIVVGHDFGEQMEGMFKLDLKSAREIALEQWRQRPLIDRLKEHWAQLFKYWI